MENISIIVKSKTREEMRNNPDLILRERELLVETDGEGDTATSRFKLGDGKTPYSQLNYISSLYALYPKFSLCNDSYTFSIEVSLQQSDIDSDNDADTNTNTNTDTNTNIDTE